MDLRQERGDNGNEATEPEQDWKARKQRENNTVGNELVKNSDRKKKSWLPPVPAGSDN